MRLRDNFRELSVSRDLDFLKIVFTIRRTLQSQGRKSVGRSNDSHMGLKTIALIGVEIEGTVTYRALWAQYRNGSSSNYIAKMIRRTCHVVVA